WLGGRGARAHRAVTRRSLMWDGLRGQTVYLDANVIIYAIETGNRWQANLLRLFEMIDDGIIFGVTSELSIAEVLAKPLEKPAVDLVRKFEIVLDETQSPIELVPVTRVLIRSAADLQGDLGIKLIDAIHVATAQSAGCHFFLTNDLRLGPKLLQPAWIDLDQG